MVALVLLLLHMNTDTDSLTGHFFLMSYSDSILKWGFLLLLSLPLLLLLISRGLYYFAEKERSRLAIAIPIRYTIMSFYLFQ